MSEGVKARGSACASWNLPACHTASGCISPGELTSWALADDIGVGSRCALCALGAEGGWRDGRGWDGLGHFGHLDWTALWCLLRGQPAPELCFLVLGVPELVFLATNVKLRTRVQDHDSSRATQSECQTLHSEATSPMPTLHGFRHRPRVLSPEFAP